MCKILACWVCQSGWHELRWGCYISFQVKKIILQINVKDNDRKATCGSINDPHIGTFDGL